jgi:hypothetical protein
MEISTGTTTGLSIYMPPANQVSVGQATTIKNTGSQTFTVLDSSGGTICTIAANQAINIFVTNNNTVAGTWDIVTLGSGGSSAANAASLAGYGLRADGSTLNADYPPSGIADGYTFSSSDLAQTKIWSGGYGNATLPPSVDVGANWFTLFKNNGTGVYTISTTGTETVDNQATVQYQPNYSSLIISTGTGYVTVGYGAYGNFFFTALTLPLTQGTTNLTVSQASSIIQEYTGSLTGNCVVVFPPVVNLYTIQNQTTANGYSITLTTGVSGGATVTVPASPNTISIICDGKNFFNANTTQSGTASVVSLAAGSAASPSLSFSSDPATGVYLPGVGTFGITAAGTSIATFGATGLTVPLGISGGTF